MGNLSDKEVKQIVRKVYTGNGLDFVLRREVSKSALRGIKSNFAKLDQQIAKDVKSGKVKRVKFAGTTRIIPVKRSTQKRKSLSKRKSFFN